MKSLSYFKQKGFTLIEVLTVAAIIVLLTGMIFINYRQSGAHLALQRSTNKLSQDLRLVEEMAMSTKEFNGIVPLGGYGIYLTTTPPDQNRYIIFADCDGDHEYDFPPAVPCTDGSSNWSEEIEAIKLEGKVMISSLSPSPLTIVFTPPDPVVRINQLTISPPAVITLIEGDSTRIITVNNIGLITID